jgi:hypothetical protein
MLISVMDYEKEQQRFTSLWEEMESDEEFVNSSDSNSDEDNVCETPHDFETDQEGEDDFESGPSLETLNLDSCFDQDITLGEDRSKYVQPQEGESSEARCCTHGYDKLRKLQKNDLISFWIKK